MKLIFFSKEDADFVKTKFTMWAPHIGAFITPRLVSIEGEIVKQYVLSPDSVSRFAFLSFVDTYLRNRSSSDSTEIEGIAFDVEY